MATKMATRYGRIWVKMPKPSLPPVMNDSYTLTRLAIAYPMMAKKISGMVSSEIWLTTNLKIEVSLIVRPSRWSAGLLVSRWIPVAAIVQPAPPGPRRWRGGPAGELR